MIHVYVHIFLKMFVTHTRILLLRRPCLSWVLGKKSINRSAVQHRPGEAAEDPSSDGEIGELAFTLQTEGEFPFIYWYCPLQARRNREIAILQRKIDEVPSRAELTQYQKRFIELYSQGVWVCSC